MSASLARALFGCMYHCVLNMLFPAPSLIQHAHNIYIARVRLVHRHAVLVAAVTVNSKAVVLKPRRTEAVGASHHLSCV